MIKWLDFSFKKILILPGLFCIITCVSNAQSSITMSANNCAISSNEMQMDILVTNTGTTDLRWNGCVIRMNIPAALIPPGVHTYAISYLGGSDFPASFPAAGKHSTGAFFNSERKLLTWASTPNMAYNNKTCNAPLIPAGQTKHIGRFSFKINSSKFQKAVDADIKWHTTSGCILYQNCSALTKGFGTPDNRVLANLCTFTVPEK
ncbi:MAG: hypothetical protein ABI741_15150 [Ferruginibacter sp.]